MKTVSAINQQIREAHRDIIERNHFQHKLLQDAIMLEWIEVKGIFHISMKPAIHLQL